MCWLDAQMLARLAGQPFGFRGCPIGTAAHMKRSLWTLFSQPAFPSRMEPPMNGIIYLVGLVVVVMAILSFIGIH
jgi:hypothetical protein